jgi:glyoxylase-like metal-dependent hydrolase (beta-lactamase superfamily II)
MSPAVHAIELPNPFFEGHCQAYVVMADPLTLIDTGVATTASFEALRSGLQRVGLQVGDVRRIVLTHKHIDHIGNAWRVQQQSGAEIWIHRSECEALVEVDASGERFAELIQQKLGQWQVPRSEQRQLQSETMSRWEIEPADVLPLDDGQQLEMSGAALGVLHTPGHTIGSVCLQLDQRLFTGDHVLPDISPNIGGGDLRHHGLLRQFLASLARVRDACDGMLALPGHGRPFISLAPRCDQLVAHHQQRLADVQRALQPGPMSVYELAGHLFGQLKGFHIVLGCAEAQAHLEWLVEQGQATPVDDGLRFKAT